MNCRIVVLTCVALGGCAGQSANPNRASATSNITPAGQSHTTGPPSDIATSESIRTGQVTITLVNPGPDATFEVSGLADGDVARLPSAQSDLAEWTSIFSLRVIGEPSANWKDQPAVLGKYSVEGGHVRFKPEFPL